jgi:sulfur transfer protein SufE
MARYKQLLFYAAKLPAMPTEQHQPANKVEGCVSQVRSGSSLLRAAAAAVG